MKGNGNELKDKIIKLARKYLMKILKVIVIPVLIVVIIISSIYYYITLDDAIRRENDLSNTPYVASQYINNVSIEKDGQILSEMTAQELWNIMEQNNNGGLSYLDTPEELLKLMNAELITQYLDTRSNPDDEIDWDSMNDVNSKNIQGIVKLKRADEDGNNFSMTYVEPEVFQSYIEQYNRSGSEEAKKLALSHFTLEQTEEGSTDSSEGDDIGILKGKGNFKQYTDLTEQQIKAIANLCKQEQGSLEGAAAEASLMANRFELVGSKFGTGGTGLYNYVRNSGWFANAGHFMDNGDAGTDYINAIKGVLINGKRTLPKYVDEHDCFSDIGNATNSGNSISVSERSQYKQYVTNINNRYGSKYIFFCFPTETSDPFGYTSKKNRKKYGDAYYDFKTGELINGTDDGDENQENSQETDNSDEWCWPTEGTNITSNYGPRKAPVNGASTNHGGIDIGVPEGTKVYACDSGTVITAENNNTAGNWVIIDHGNGYITKYMHNSQLKVSPGDTVKKGQVIALSGNTGNSSGPHVHFQVEYNGKTKDPLKFKYNNNMGDGSITINQTSDSKSDSNIDSSTIKWYAKVATWSEETITVESNDPNVSSSSVTTYNMSSTDVNYQEFINGYTMPFEYLWALLVITEDKEFALELADLVYNSEIEITVHDNLTVTTDTDVNTYSKKKKIDTNAEVTVNYGEQENIIEGASTKSGNWTDEEPPVDYKVTKTVIDRDNTLDVSLTKANVWILEYIQEYTFEKPKVQETDPVIVSLDDQDYPDTPDSTSHEDIHGHAQNLLETEKKAYESTYAYVDGKVNFVNEEIYNAVVNRKRTTTYKTETSNYVSSPAKINEKTDKKVHDDNTGDNFITILSQSKHKGARKRILEVSSWLFEILESNDSTKSRDMVDLTKYLLYKLTGNSYGVTEYDFSEYVNTDFSDYASSTGDYVVKTNAQNSATVVTDKNKLEEGLKKWLKNANGQKKNALSVVDEVLNCQEKYHVNAVFVYAFLRNETGIGTADTNYVKNDNNWGSWNLGHKFGSPEDNIETITRNIENGSIYFKQGRISVSTIGEIYCPNEPSHPNQGDEWVKNVQKYMSELYSCMGITESSGNSGSVAKGGAGTIGVYTSTTGRKYNLYLQGNGAPWAGNDYGDLHSMALAGCGPTAEAIIASSYNAEITPETTRKDIVSKYGRGNHSSATCIEKSLNTLLPGVKTSVGKFDENRIEKCLKKSGQVWLVVQNCKYTSGAHCIALIDYKDSGKVYVAHGTAKSRPYKWDSLSYIKKYIKYADVLYVGGQ